MGTTRSTAEHADFIDIQLKFAAHIRDPQNNPHPPDVETHRMKVYTELFYNNVEDFIAGSFPVLREITDDETWQSMIRDYFKNHKAKTPLFPEMPREFLNFLEHERQTQDNDYPFLLELAHYEWVEVALSLSELEPDWTAIDKHADLLNGQAVLSPLAWLLSYQYPVHQIGPDFLPEAPAEQASFLLLYRDADDEVHFMELNPVSARLIHLIEKDNKQTTQQILSQIATELQHPDPAQVIRAGLEILTDLQQRNVILGVKKT